MPGITGTISTFSGAAYCGALNKRGTVLMDFLQTAKLEIKAKDK
jgi:hypothetical protein